MGASFSQRSHSLEVMDLAVKFVEITGFSVRDLQLCFQIFILINCY